MAAARLWYRHKPIPQVVGPELSRYQAAKGLVVMGALLVVFFLDQWPRDVAALTAAGLLLSSRRMASRDVLGLVDW